MFRKPEYKISHDRCEEIWKILDGKAPFNAKTIMRRKKQPFSYSTHKFSTIHEPGTGWKYETLHQLNDYQMLNSIIKTDFLGQ